MRSGSFLARPPAAMGSGTFRMGGSGAGLRAGGGCEVLDGGHGSNAFGSPAEATDAGSRQVRLVQCTQFCVLCLIFL